MPAPTPDERRALLNSWIAGSRRTDRRLNLGVVVGVVAAVLVRFASSTWSTVALLIVIGVYGIGRWITSSHISDWKTKLEAIDRAERKAK